MRVLVTGAKGQLGYDIVKRLELQNIENLGIGRDEIDITDKQATIRFIGEYKPNVVIHCAAYTSVDKAEEEKEKCYSINVNGTRHIAEACSNVDAAMVYISTDYVFNGDNKEPYEIGHTPDPICYYGQTKYFGELEVKKYLKKYYIVRISWVFGQNGSNFVKTMLNLGKRRSEIRVVADQIGSPTYTYDAAKMIYNLIAAGKYGTYHCTNEGFCSWYEFAKEIFRLAGYDIAVTPICSGEYHIKAKRPGSSRLSKHSLDVNGLERLPEWKDALKRFLNEICLNKKRI
jgi:dTDP-4-dehydrorhamnose reductase